MSRSSTSSGAPRRLPRAARRPRDRRSRGRHQVEGNQRAVRETVEAFGKLDTFVANAGLGRRVPRADRHPGGRRRDDLPRDLRPQHHGRDHRRARSPWPSWRAPRELHRHALQLVVLSRRRRRDVHRQQARARSGSSASSRTSSRPGSRQRCRPRRHPHRHPHAGLLRPRRARPADPDTHAPVETRTRRSSASSRSRCTRTPSSTPAPSCCSPRAGRAWRSLAPSSRRTRGSGSAGCGGFAEATTSPSGSA